ncbi:MAG TPA: HD-GYP domain-containing protein [Dehalococcoidia bacterium]|nr:HD-GYP domain-containing protein [Dehalococcoidia bacterium]
MTEKKSRWKTTGKVAGLLIGSAALCGALAALTILVSPFAAAMGGCFVICVALGWTVRQRHKDQGRVEARLDEVRGKYSAIIDALSSAVGLQDDMKASPSRRVADLAFILAQQIGVRGEEVQLVQKASVLADIGKLGIAAGILGKAGELTDQEWAEMRRHTEIGAQLATEVLGQTDVSEIVLSHHERFDGQGYPRGLRGEDIPLGARIYAVADAYMAMTSDRPHRKKMTHEMALKEILRNSLTQFDPEVVRAFVQAEEMGLIVPPEEVRDEFAPMPRVPVA